MSIYNIIRNLKLGRPGLISCDEVSVSISNEVNTKSFYGKVVVSNICNAFSGKYDYASIRVNTWAGPVLTPPPNYVELKFLPTQLNKIVVVYSEDIYITEGTPRKYFEIGYADGTTDVVDFGGVDIGGIKYQIINLQNKVVVYFKIAFELDDVDEKLVEDLKLYFLLFSASQDYDVIGYVDSSGNFIPVSSDNPIPISGDISVVGGNGGFPLVLGWDDVKTFKDIEHPEQIEVVDEQKAFDKDFFTYAQFTFHPNGEYSILLRKPCNISGMTILGVPPSEITKLTYQISYVDGTKDFGNPQQITDAGGYIPINPLKKCLTINLKNDTLNDISVNIFEFLIYTVLQVVNTGADIQIGAVEVKNDIDDTRLKIDSDNSARVGIYDTKGTRINPATEDTLFNIAQNILYLNKNLFALFPKEVLKFSGNFSVGTYNTTYTPSEGEKLYISRIVLNSYAGRAELRLYWGTDIVAQCSVDASYYEMNAESVCERIFEGDGTTQLRLEFIVYTSTSYFAKAVSKEINVVEVL